jgi:hypothetical protein
MFDIVYNDGIYDVIFSGNVLVSFHALADAQDYIACMKWERDNAFNDYGSEFDIEVY